MHASSLSMMNSLLSMLATDAVGKTVLDCGSAIAGTGLQQSYRDITDKLGLQYTGFDACEGKNVDIVGNIYAPQLVDEQFDFVISGQMLEHLTFPLLAAQVMKGLVKPGGWIILIAPWQYGIHRYPIDCWRILPDGMLWLLEGFEEVQSDRSHNDCWGIGKRPADYKEPWIISRS